MQQLLRGAQIGGEARGTNFESVAICGIRISLEEVKNGYCAESLGRMHIARLLVKRGYVRTFERLLIVSQL
jgi:hypothetical protein